MLNREQLIAFETLKKYIKDRNDDSIFVVKGWAGTGKTYCISHLVRHILEVVYPSLEWYKIGITGPTNKSVRVIRNTSNIDNPRVTFQTIHKLLGMKEKILDDGNIVFESERTFGGPDIRSIKLLIIDEVSMLDDRLFNQIVQYTDRMKIICMGDPAQIPPVGKIDCIPFREDMFETYKIKTLQLSEIMRQSDGNGIIDASINIRENLSLSTVQFTETILNSRDQGIKFLNLNDDEVRATFGELLSKYFKSNNDIDFVKVLAWRNKTVGTMNTLIRNLIYGDAGKSKILVGDKLIVNSPIFKDKTIVFNTNDEFVVEEIDIKYKEDLKYYDVRVGKDRVEILHEDSETDFKIKADKLKQHAIDTKGAKKAWIKYYTFLRMFADVSYSYAITCHKSQGSTYDTTFILESDIDANPDIVERNRIKYTAYTRASRKVYVLKRW